MKSRKRVEIGRVGKFPLSTGMFEFTKERFASAVEKAKGRTAPAIGIGHTDERWQKISAGDGEPALGRIENLTLDEDDKGAVLLGDMVDMPDWFADALPSAFSRRSLEGSCEDDDLTITALKVLGVKTPGIHTLEDLKEFVSDEGPALIAAGADNDGHEFTVVLASDGQIRASANLEDIRNAWQSEYPNKYDDEKPSDWWVLEEIRVDPDELICKHGEQLYRQPWTANTDGTFTFGAQTEVVRQYVDKVAASAPAAVYIPPARRQKQEVVRVDPKKMREALGLPEDATDEQVSAKLAEQEALKLQAVPAVDPAKPVESDPAKTEHAPAAGDPTKPADDPAKPAETPAVPEGMALIDSATLEGLQVAASRADELYEANDIKERDALLDGAQGEGRFPKSRRDHYAKLYEADRDGTRKLLTASAAEGGLAPGLVPVDAPRGHSVAASEGGSDLLAHTRAALRIKTPKEA